MDIAPDKQNIDRVFSNTTYYIDFYQREYKWTEEPVRRLLDDVFHVFEDTYRRNKHLDPTPQTVSVKYPWYYLNSYVTNTVDGRVYVVDGQQRLTTLTLILIQLYRMAKAHGSAQEDWIKAKIAGHDGTGPRFWMNHERHLGALRAMFEGTEVPTSSGLTAVNMKSNHQIIARELEERLDSRHKLETFVFYFLHRLVLINLSVEQTDVPMVFEVINDRGVRLRPYEILKGKLLGQIDKIELEHGEYNSSWESQVQFVNSFKPDEIDAFFVYYLKSKFSDTRSTAERFDKDYHREMFKKDINNVLGLDHDPSKVKSFLSQNFAYFTKLYGRIWTLSLAVTEGFDHTFYNRLNQMDSQFLLVLSACHVNDAEEDVKIQEVTYQIDRLFSLLRLQRAYDSNEFADAIYEISTEIRDAPASAIKPAFDKKLLDLLSARRELVATDPFEYAQFKNTSITDIPTRFTRYFFARVDSLLASGANNPPFVFEDLVTKTGHHNGYHIEHILSRNDGNLAFYASNPDQFEVDRNRLGAILLLKGRDNISSSNEIYAKKLESYAGTLYWNQTLTEAFYKSNNDFKNFMNQNNFTFRHYSDFGPHEIDERQKLLFDMAAIIWN